MPYSQPVAIRIVCTVIAGAIIVILAIASQRESQPSAWCNLNTMNCYERLAGGVR